MRPVLGDISSQCEPVGVTRHLDVGKQHDDLLPLFGQQRDCGIATFSVETPKTGLLENLASVEPALST